MTTPTLSPYSHRSVMPAEVEALAVLRPAALAVDATVGAGGHAAALLPRLAPDGHLIALDVDPDALALAAARLGPLARAHAVKLDLLRSNFRELPAVLDHHAPGRQPLLILADLGLSSLQLDNPARGFSFRADAPLDLRMDPDLPRTGAALLRELPQQELADLLYELGGERGARRIARFIVEARQAGAPIATTGQLERLVRRALKVRRWARIHPATRTFMALRMAVNDELPALRAFLDAAPSCLAPGGRLIVIAFHSGEDRLVKQQFKLLASTGRFHLVQKSVLRPGPEELRANPRSRSARVRVLQRG